MSKPHRPGLPITATAWRDADDSSLGERYRGPSDASVVSEACRHALG